jgi:hypothetical protein
MTIGSDASPAMDLLDGAIDVHVHTAPDLVDRYGSDLELAREARAADMDGLVVKSHVVPTVDRVDLVNDCVGQELLYGGIALNGSVGGVNPAAVEVALDLGARIVWLPTAWSANHARQARAAGDDQFVGQRIPDADEELSVLDGDELTAAARSVVDLVGEHDATLATGHLAVDAIEAVVDACADAGVRCLVNHPFFRVVDLPIERQVALAERGAIMEYCAYSIRSTDGHDVERVAEAVERVGANSCLLATDFGQADNPPVEGLARFAGGLLDAGLERATITRLVEGTPARVLGR